MTELDLPNLLHSWKWVSSSAIFQKPQERYEAIWCGG